jgi:hypothetical protein
LESHWKNLPCAVDHQFCLSALEFSPFSLCMVI